jgi:hypothetical protein
VSIGERLLRIFPGLLAGGLALIYVLGAIATGSEFAGAGIDPSEAVPLLSIQQLLARGIGVVVKPIALLTITGLLVALIGAIAVQLFHLVEANADEPGQAGTGLEAETALIVGGIALLTVILTPLNQVPGTLLMVLGIGCGFALVDSDISSQWVWRLLPALAIGMFVFGLGVNAYTDPIPIPRLQLTLMARDQTRQGRYVTHSDSTWYLYDRGKNEIQAYPDEAVHLASISKGPSGGSKSLWGYTWGFLRGLVPL